MMQRSQWVHVALFGVAYSGFLLYFHLTAAGSLPAAVLSVATGSKWASAPTEALAISRRTAVINPASPAPRAVSSSEVQTRSESTPGEPTSNDTDTRADAQTLAEVNALSAQALTAATPSDRFAAIVKLKHAMPTPDAVQAMGIILATDPLPRNRMMAIDSLRNMAAREDADGMARAALKNASLDTDAAVAARARSAYEQLAGVASDNS